MSKKVWIIIAIIVALLIVIFLFIRNKKKKEEAAREAELQAAANSTQGTGTLAEALSGLIPVIMQNVGKDKKVTVVPDLNATSNMGTGSTTRSMLGVFGGTTRGISDASVIVSSLPTYVDKMGVKKQGTGPDWQGMCYCNGVWARECCPSK